MKISCFDLEPWEIDYLQQHLVGHELSLSEDTLSEKNTKQAADAEVLGVFIYSKVTPALLDQMPHLKLIVTYSTGFDHIDLEACRQRNIGVCNVPTYGENTVAEHTFGLLLNLTRKIHKAHQKTIQGDFTLDGLRGTDLKGKTLGIVGLGHIGEHVARIARGFEMDIVVHDPALENNTSISRVRFLSFEDLLETADVISFHCPLNAQTTHLLNKENINACKEGVYIINTARGPVIETEALLQGLESGRVVGVGLDVLEEEQCIIREEKEILTKQFDSDCMRITLENHVLLHHPKVIITPHNAFNSQEALERIFDTTVENIQSFATGTVINAV